MFVSLTGTPAAEGQLQDELQDDLRDTRYTHGGHGHVGMVWYECMLSVLILFIGSLICIQEAVKDPTLPWLIH